MGRRLSISLLAIGVLVWTAAAPASGAPVTRRADLTSAGKESPGGAIYEGISGSGRYVVFETSAALVPGDTNGLTDVYIRDRWAGTTTRASLTTTNKQSNGASGYSAISRSGRFVVFWSEATNLVPHDTNGQSDVFLRDRKLRKTFRVSVSSDERQGDGGSSGAAVTPDGRYVLFGSDATNLVGNDTNGTSDLFVRDRRKGVTRRVSVGNSGQQGDGGTNGYPSPSAISPDGRYIVFDSASTNFVAGDTNGQPDVFLRDRVKRTTRLVSRSSAGQRGNARSVNPSMTPDARLIVFDSMATNLVAGDLNLTGDVFLRNRRTGKTSRLSVSSVEAEANGGSSYPTISADGRYVAFDSGASNLVGGDGNSAADVFVRDRKLGKTRRVSVSSAGVEGNAESSYAFISADGRFVAFQSMATNLVGNDGNNSTDIFVRGPLH